MQILINGRTFCESPVGYCAGGTGIVEPIDTFTLMGRDPKGNEIGLRMTREEATEAVHWFRTILHGEHA